MKIDIADIKKLRVETEISVSECKRALEEAKGDLEKARKLLSKWGATFAEKKSARQVKTGAIFSYVHHNKKIGAMVELMCETDFVAKTDSFIELGTNIALQVASDEVSDVASLMKSPFIKDPTLTIEDCIKAQIAKIGENITIGKVARFAL